MLRRYDHIGSEQITRGTASTALEAVITEAWQELHPSIRHLAAMANARILLHGEAPPDDTLLPTEDKFDPNGGGQMKLVLSLGSNKDCAHFTSRPRRLHVHETRRVPSGPFHLLEGTNTFAIETATIPATPSEIRKGLFQQVAHLLDDVSGISKSPGFHAALTSVSDHPWIKSFPDSDHLPAQAFASRVFAEVWAHGALHPNDDRMPRHLPPATLRWVREVVPSAHEGFTDRSALSLPVKGKANKLLNILSRHMPIGAKASTMLETLRPACDMLDRADWLLRAARRSSAPLGASVALGATGSFMLGAGLKAGAVAGAGLWVLDVAGRASQIAATLPAPSPANRELLQRTENMWCRQNMISAPSF